MRDCNKITQMRQWRWRFKYRFLSSFLANPIINPDLCATSTLISGLKESLNKWLCWYKHAGCKIIRTHGKSARIFGGSSERYLITYYKKERFMQRESYPQLLFIGWLKYTRTPLPIYFGELSQISKPVDKNHKNCAKERGSSFHFAIWSPVTIRIASLRSWVTM